MLSNIFYYRHIWDTQKIFDITGLNRNEIFLDIGHGIGNAPIQAAVILGCEARGLELVEDRFLESCKIRDSILTTLKNNIQVCIPMPNYQLLLGFPICQ